MSELDLWNRKCFFLWQHKVYFDTYEAWEKSNVNAKFLLSTGIHIPFDIKSFFHEKKKYLWEELNLFQSGRLGKGTSEPISFLGFYAYFRTSYFLGCWKFQAMYSFSFILSSFFSSHFSLTYILHISWQKEKQSFLACIVTYLN